MNRNLILASAAIAALSLTAACSKPTNSGTDPNSASNQTTNSGAAAPRSEHCRQSSGRDLRRRRNRRSRHAHQRPGLRHGHGDQRYV